MKVSCSLCGIVFNKAPAEIRKTKNNFCSRSHAALFNNKIRKRPEKKVIVKPTKKTKPKCYILGLISTKDECFGKSKSWQAARSLIQRAARFIYFHVNPAKKCKHCGYSKHVEVAHIKPVSSFSGDTPLYVINHITNLVGLCPNHHWEYDNGLLDIEQ